MTKEGYILRLRRSRILRLCRTRTALLLCALCVACGSAFGAAKVPPEGRVTSVRFWSLGDITRVAIEVSTPFTYGAERISNPDRLFFDIRGASPDMVKHGIRSMPVGDTFVNQIRIAETQPRVTRVVLDLARPVTVTTSQLANPNRLIVELRSKDGSTVTFIKPPAMREEPAPREVAAVEPAPEARPAKVKPEPKRFDPPKTTPPHREVVRAEPVLPNPPALVALSKPTRVPSIPDTTVRELPAPPPPPVSEPSGPAPEPAKAGVQGDRSLTRVLGLKIARIVLDPGHGGVDVGTHGPSGYREKDLVLDVSQRLGALLEERLGSEVVFTRSDDSYVPLEDRTKIANQHKADLFLSIHANSSPYRAAAGVETYILSLNTTKAASELAARENASSSSSIHDLKFLVEKIAAADKANESAEFASRLQISLSALSTKSADQARNRGVKRAPFVVLIGAGMPSVLAEIGFLTNGEEETLLRKPEYRQKIAEALYKGIANYTETLSRFDLARKD